MKDKMRLACMEGNEWQKEFWHCSDVLFSIDERIDISSFLKTINKFDQNKDVILTFLSKEYLKVGMLWLEMIGRIGYNQFIVIAADIETELFLNSFNVPYCRVVLNESESQNDSFISRHGFTVKGIAVTTLKYPFVKKILQLGFNVLLMDIDALLLKQIPEKYFLNIDVAFQRIIYHPKPIAKSWGFAACSGFVWFRSNEKTLSLIENILNIQLKIQCDQISLNVALWESEINWLQPDYIAPEIADIEISHRINNFISLGLQAIDGYGAKPKISIRALPPTLFWRNDLVAFDLTRIILFHPNSPKEQNGKIQVYKNYKVIH